MQEGGEMFVGREVATSIQTGFGVALLTEPAESSELKARVSPGRPGREALRASSGRPRPRRRRAGKGCHSDVCGPRGAGAGTFLGALPSRINEPLLLSTQPARQPRYGLYSDFT